MQSQRDPLSVLVDRAMWRGYATFQQLDAYLPDEGGSPQIADDLVLALEERGLDLIEEPEQTRDALGIEPAETPVARQEPQTAEPAELTGQTGSSAVMSGDPIRMYLRQMASIPLLKREREINLAKKIEASRKRFRRALMESHLATTAALGTLERVYSGELPFERTIRTSDAENARKEQILRKMSCNFPTIRHLIDRNVADFGRLVT